MQSVLEVQAEDAEFVVHKDFGPENRRKREFNIGCCIGAVLSLYSVWCFYL